MHFMVVQLVLWTCSLLEQRLTSSLFDESTVRDADSVVQGDYGANIVGQYISVLILHSVCAYYY